MYERNQNSRGLRETSVLTLAIMLSALTLAVATGVAGDRSTSSGFAVSSQEQATTVPKTEDLVRDMLTHD